MDASMIQRALMAMRGQSPDVASAGQTSAPSAMMPGAGQAYGDPGQPAAQQSGMPSMQFNPQLEGQVQAQGGNVQLEPLLQQIMKHLGMMSMIRNRSNQLMDPTQG